ncbi:MAG TPA: SDR family oxidoreductase [Streptosporangiaceae bacterium]|jgi:NAD(P)-dependent dehydrogenase (short-subunit alcohol dehydrogenase family)|nr:SDR family oxidoreductase [Streptosporangiaceae bacterium]
MDLGHAGARVIVTGSGANIGRGIVLGFAAEGARVLITDIDGPQAAGVADAAAAAGAAAIEYVTADLTEPEAAAAVVGRAVGEWGGVDVLVNNAGWSRPGFFAEQTDRALWQQTIEVNLYTAYACTQEVLGPMRAGGGGAVVFISSDSAFGAIRQGIYGSTKAGLIALARTIAREQGRHGIRSNVVAPGLVIPDEDEPVGPHSVWADGRDALFSPEQTDYVLRTQPLRRLTTAADIAGAVLWISSPLAARQVTGQVIAVGGGSSMP